MAKRVVELRDVLVGFAGIVDNVAELIQERGAIAWWRRLAVQRDLLGDMELTGVAFRFRCAGIAKGMKYDLAGLLDLRDDLRAVLPVRVGEAEHFLRSGPRFRNRHDVLLLQLHKLEVLVAIIRVFGQKRIGRRRRSILAEYRFVKNGLGKRKQSLSRHTEIPRVFWLHLRLCDGGKL